MPRKRANGEGTIYKRADGTWSGQYWTDALKGRKRKTVYGKTKEQVRQKIAKAIAERDVGVHYDAKGMSFGELLDYWLETFVAARVKRSTYENYEYVVRMHLRPTLGSVKLDKLRSTHLQNLYADKLATGLSPRTVELVHTIAKAALKRAVRWEFVFRNVADSADPPKVPKKGVNVLTLPQVRTFLQAAKGERLEALYVVALTAGLREGELLGLRWKDVNLEQGTFEIRQQLIRTRAGRSFGSLKSGEGRDILMLPATILALRGHLERQREERTTRGDLWQDYDLVFPTTIGTPLDVSGLTYRSFRPLLEHAGLPRIRFHDLRHTYATLMLQVDAHPRTVQDILGHAEFGVTMDTYTHPSLDSQREPAHRLDRLLDL